MLAKQQSLMNRQHIYRVYSECYEQYPQKIEIQKNKIIPNIVTIVEAIRTIDALEMEGSGEEGVRVIPRSLP